MSAHPFTPEFIAMTKAAEEIQAMRPDRHSFLEGDYFLFSGDGIGEPQPRLVLAAGAQSLPDLEPPFLPRLDQLLGVLDLPAPLHLVGMLAYETSMKRDPYWQGFAEWHELALAVVMREKYGKVWRDGAWVKA